MIVYYDEGRVEPEYRLHPYVASNNEQSGFVDFKKHPEQIPRVLELFGARVAKYLRQYLNRSMQ